MLKRCKVLMLFVYSATVLLCTDLLMHSEDAWSANECRHSRGANSENVHFIGLDDTVAGKWVVSCGSVSYLPYSVSVLRSGGVLRSGDVLRSLPALPSADDTPPRDRTTPDSDGNTFPLRGQGKVVYNHDAVGDFWQEAYYRAGLLVELDLGVSPDNSPRYTEYFADETGNELPPDSSESASVDLPKRYIRTSCTEQGNTGKKCFVAIAKSASDPNETVYWRLRKKSGDGDEDLAGEMQNGGFVAEGSNLNAFIVAGSSMRALGVTEREFVIDGITIEPIFSRYDADGMKINELDDERSATVAVFAGNDLTADENLDYTITVRGGATIFGGALYYQGLSDGNVVRVPKPDTDDNLEAIYLGGARDAGGDDDPAYVGRLTVNIVDGTVRTYRSLTASADTAARGIFVNSGVVGGTDENPNQLVVKLQDKAKVAIRDAEVSPGKITTSGDNSPAIWASAENSDSLGSIRIDTPLEISTSGAKSHGVWIQSGQPEDALSRATRSGAVAVVGEDAGNGSGINFNTLFYHVAGAGRYPTASTVNAYTREDLIAALVFDEDEGDAESALLENLGIDRASLARIVAALRNELTITTEVIAEAKRSYADSTAKFEYGANGILGRIRSSSDAESIAGNNEFRVEINDDADVDGSPSIATSGPYATAIKGESSGNLSTIWIGSEGDFADDEQSVAVDHDSDSETLDAMTYRTRVLVDRPITTKGIGSHGVYAQFTNERSIRIEVESTIIAENEGSKAILIDTIPGSANTISIGSAGNIQGDIQIGAGTNSISGSGSIYSTIMGTMGGSLAALDLGDATRGSRIVLHSSLDITGDVTLGSGDDFVTVRGSLRNRFNLGDGDDTVTVAGTVYELNLGAGDNTLIVERGIISSASGVNTMRKTTEGVVTIGSVEFSASNLRVERGELRISGHLNLGRSGQLTVSEGAVLTFVADTDEEVSHGRITADALYVLSSEPNVRISSEDNSDLSDEDASTVLSGVLGAGTRVLSLASGVATEAQVRVVHANSERLVGRIETNTQEPAPEDPTGPTDPTDPTEPTDPTDPGTGPTQPVADDDDNTGLYAAGAIAVIWWLICETGAIGSDGSNICFGKSQGDSGGGVQYRNTGMNSWARLQSDKGTNPVLGLAFGTDIQVGENGRIGFSAMPNASGTAGSFGASLNRSSSISGGLYSLQGELDRGIGYASAALTHANLTAETGFENIVAGGGMLGGEFKMRQSHLQLTAGSRLEVGGVSWSPSIGLYGGMVDQDSYSASNAALVAKVPGYRLNYHGWKLGLRAEAKEAMLSSGGLRWRPGVSVDMYRTATNGPSSLKLNQTDRTGALNFSGNLPLGGLPKSIVALRAGGTIELPRAGQIRLDYVGMEMDGEIQHGALLKYQKQF